MDNLLVGPDHASVMQPLLVGFTHRFRFGFQPSQHLHKNVNTCSYICSFLFYAFPSDTKLSSLEFLLPLCATTWLKCILLYSSELRLHLNGSSSDPTVSYSLLHFLISRQFYILQHHLSIWQMALYVFFFLFFFFFSLIKNGKFLCPGDFVYFSMYFPHVIKSLHISSTLIFGRQNIFFQGNRTMKPE